MHSLQRTTRHCSIHIRRMWVNCELRKKAPFGQRYAALQYKPLNGLTLGQKTKSDNINQMISITDIFYCNQIKQLNTKTSDYIKVLSLY